MKKSIIIAYICLTAFLFLLAGLNLDSGASPDGRGDASNEYNCVSSCHFSRSKTSEITMESTSTAVKTGDEITVTVSVLNSEQSAGDKIGVFLVSAFESSESKPADAGWVILEDPNGATNNYVEKTADEDGSAVFSWKLKAPESPDKFTLYSREHHGNGNSYFQDFATGLEIDVAGATGVPGDSSEPDDTGNPIDDTPGPLGDENPDGTPKVDENNDRDRIFSNEPPLAPLVLGLIVAGMAVMITHILRD